MAFTSSSSTSSVGSDSEPSKPDLVFHDASTVSETVPTIINVEPSTTKLNKDLSQSNRPSSPIIKDWVSDSEDEYEEGLHKGYDRFQILLSQLETHGVCVFTKDANQKFLRSLPSSWSQVSLIMRTKPGVDTLNFDDVYNNLRVFESDVKGSTRSSSSTQNVSFVSSNNTSSTNEVNIVYGVSTSFGYNSQKEGSSSYTDDLIRRDAGNAGYKAMDNGKRSAKQDEHKVMVTIDGEGVDWTVHAEDDTADYALMAFNSSNSSSDTKMNAKDKSTHGYGSQIHDGVLSYKNEVFESVFNSSSSDVEDSHVNDRFAKVKGMHVVPPPMIGNYMPPKSTWNYMPPKSNFGIDESKFTYGSKQSTTGESDAKTSDLDSCKSSSSEETCKTMPKPIESKSKVVNEPKVLTDALINKEFESDSDEEHVTIPLKEQEKPSFAFVNTVEHVTHPRQTTKEQNTCSQNPKHKKSDWNGLMSKRMGLGYGFTKKACFWNHKWYQSLVLSMIDVKEEEHADIEEVLEVVKAAKLMTKLVTTARAIKVSVLRKRRGVIIQDPEKPTTTTVQPKVQAKDKGKAILIAEPNPLKMKAQIELDEEVTRQLEVELNADINWNAEIKQVKRNERLNDSVMKYLTLKRKPLTQAQARRNMILYLKNLANATPLASKIPIVDYKIHTERNRTYFKIIRADGNHMLFINLSTMLKNFNREYFESLWNIMRDIFEKTKPKNYSYDYFLNTLKIMFQKPNVEASIWKDQKGRYGLAKVKSWKLIESCGVRCITFLTTQILLLVKRMYPLTHFTLEQMLNDVRLQVKDESEMSLEILRLAMKMEHYLEHTDYPIWEVIQKGNGHVQVSTDTNGQIRVLPPKTAEEILAKERERKARIALLMAIPEDHLQQIKSFSVSNSEGLHKGYGRFQSLLSQLETHGHFARECRSKWNQDSRIRDEGNTGYKARDNRKRYAKHDKHKAMVTIDGEEAKKEKEEFKTKLEIFQSSSKGLSKLLNSQTNAKGKSGLGYGSQIHDGVLSYENKVFESVFDSSFSDVEDSHVNDRFANVKGMHAVPSPVTGNYMPFKFDFGIDDSSEETLKTMHKPIESKPKVVNEPKVWTDAPIIEEDKSVSVVGGKWETAVKASADTELLVLSLDYKFPDENQVLLRVPRQHNMYSFNLENIVPSRGLACLIAKAIVDESTKWHRRTKDETSGILKDFIRQIEKQLNQKVKTIKCDNGTKFKNMDIIEFCGSEGIKRKYSSARTPKQNGVAERKNKNLIKATRTMLSDSFLRNSEMEADHAQEYYVLPLWSSYTSTIKSSKAKNRDEKLNKDTDSKTNKEPVDQEDQAFLEELERLKRQEKEANDATETLRKITHVNAASTPLNTTSTPTNQDDSKTPSLEDIYKVSRDGIFTSASYDDEGVVVDFINLEPAMNDKKDIMLVQVYVDDIIFGSTKKSWCDEFETLMKKWFQMSSMGKLTFFLGLLVKQKEDGIFISHDKYVTEIMKKFDFLNVKTASTPIETKKPLVKNEEAVDVDVNLYRSMIGSLMYLTAFRLDIIYVVCACSRFQVTPKTSHLQAVKRIFRKSTTGGCQFLGKRLNSW
uniref:Uncharacterized mitochondrial protein AtMg00810-like n=1 Tax=Tanacetum cinerariifolium TaxID=118510 RepID=A0A6L2MKY2_TANCI|nr:uncharacterized mitochondrial protein AtMg00810-like [Tanacetum cinerariifolium]